MYSGGLLPPKTQLCSIGARLKVKEKKKMMTHFKAAVFFVAAALVLAMPVAAQNAPYDPDPSGGVYIQDQPAWLESNTSKATAGVFSSEVDDSMSVLWYKDVEFEKMFSFIGYGGNFAFNPIHLGFATRVGGLYVGAWYTGNILRSHDETTETVINNYNLATQLKTSTITTTSYNQFMTSSNNQLEVLIGIAGMGIKLGFWESMFSGKTPNHTATVTENSNNNTVTYTDEIEEYTYLGGHLRPSLEWGMNLDVGSLSIRPIVVVGFDIYQDKYLLTAKGQSTGGYPFGYTTPGAEARINRFGHDNGYMRPEFVVGVEVDLAADEKTTKTIVAGYGLGLSIFNTDYDVFGVSGAVKGTVWYMGSSEVTNTLTSKTTTNYSQISINEQTSMDHAAILGYYYDKEIVENLTLGVFAGVPVSIGVASSDNYDKRITTVRTEYAHPSLGINTTTTTEVTDALYQTNTTHAVANITKIEVEPQINLGAKYAFFPGRFSINAGIKLNPVTFTTTTTKSNNASANRITRTKTVDDNGNVVSESVAVESYNAGSWNDATSDSTIDSVKVENNWGGFGAGIYGGFVFNFNNNAAVDLVVGTGFTSAASDFQLDLTTVNVLFTLKF
jgi:hypothetical protein